MGTPFPTLHSGTHAVVSVWVLPEGQREITTLSPTPSNRDSAEDKQLANISQEISCAADKLNSLLCISCFRLSYSWLTQRHDQKHHIFTRNTCVWGSESH